VNASQTTAIHAEAAKPVRCARYARVSVVDASASELTSIDAQVEACQYFISSQHALGWVAIEPSYADHGYSCTNLTRPALQALLADMAEHKIDVVVVHRLDRLSRSIGDLCALVPFFEGPRIRLVSLVQSIDTATPSGRLTLNLLTSFAQFEREVTGERTREKLAATRARGMWQGSATPLGYGVDWDQRLVVVDPEAGAVRDIFRRFVALGSTNALLEDLARHGFKTKAWKTKHGKKCGGRPFDRNALYKLLNNRMYIGEVYYHGDWHRGQHTPIVDLELWHQVHDLKRQRARRTGVPSTPRSEVAFPLKGRLYRQDGRPFKPSESSPRKGRRYRYYIPQRSAEEKANGTGPVNLPADEIHAAVVHHFTPLPADRSSIPLAVPCFPPKAAGSVEYRETPPAAPCPLGSSRRPQTRTRSNSAATAQTSSGGDIAPGLSPQGPAVAYVPGRPSKQTPEPGQHDLRRPPRPARTAR
jgi:site-specific DNA recombinase